MCSRTAGIYCRRFPTGGKTAAAVQPLYKIPTGSKTAAAVQPLYKIPTGGENAAAVPTGDKIPTGGDGKAAVQPLYKIPTGGENAAAVSGEHPFTAAGMPVCLRQNAPAAPCPVRYVAMPSFFCRRDDFIVFNFPLVRPALSSFKGLRVRGSRFCCYRYRRFYDN